MYTPAFLVLAKFCQKEKFKIQKLNDFGEFQLSEVHSINCQISIHGFQWAAKISKDSQREVLQYGKDHEDKEFQTIVADRKMFPSIEDLINSHHEEVNYDKQQHP